MAAASNNAILNIGRLNAFRLNYVEPALKKIRDSTLTITLDGAPLKIRIGSLVIHDVINDNPNTASFIVDNATPPTVGKRFRVVLGIDPAYLLFVGELQAARYAYVGRPTVSAWACEAIDDTARGDWLRPFGAWEGVSASTVAQQLIAAFAPGYSSAGVQAGLPAVTVYLDGTERLNGALRLLAKLIGGYYYFEDYVLHLFQGDEASVANPDDVTGAPGQMLNDPPFSTFADDSQIRTRCYGKGHSEPTLSAVTAGDTVIPIANAVMFNSAGGKAISEWQRLTYTGTAIGGAGALVGPGVTPSAPPVIAALAAGAGVTPGAHQYAYTWVTAAGETAPSPVAAVTVPTGSLPRPTAAPTFLGHGGPGGNDNVDPLQSGAWAPGDTVEIGFSHATSNVTTSFTPMGPTISVIAQQSPYYYHVPGDSAKSLYISLPYSLDPNVKYLQLWHRVNGGPWRWWLGPANHPEYLSPYAWNLNNPAYYSASGATPPVADVTFQQVSLTGISTGPAGVTARKLYRSAANTVSPLKLVANLGDNATTTYVDALFDAGLGATAPATDTSGLTMPAGQVLPGAAAMPVSGTGWARAAGGWAIIGNGAQVIRYTAISGNQLTGIPASGAGAITAAVNYNSTITGAPMLTGVSGLGAALIAGAPINIWVQVDDPAAQSVLAARVGGTGIVEQLIVDERRGEPSLIALCTADLALYSRSLLTVRYTCFDPKTRSGRLVRIHLATPVIDVTLMIQDVTIEKPTGSDALPRFTVTASSVRTSLPDLLRRMVGELEEGF
jgi:hypothetical protein